MQGHPELQHARRRRSTIGDTHTMFDRMDDRDDQQLSIAIAGIARHPAGNSQQDLRYFAALLMRHCRPLIWFNLAVVISASVFVTLVTPTYRARAVVSIEPARLTIGETPISLLSGARFDEFYETRYQMLRSRALAESTVEALDLWNDPELHPRDADAGATSHEHRQGVVDSFIRRLRIRSIPSTSLITILYDSENPLLAARVVNAVAEGFIDANQTAREVDSSDKLTRLRAVLRHLDNLLDDAESALRDMRHRLPGIDNYGQDLSEQEAGLLDALPELALLRTTVSAPDLSPHSASADDGVVEHGVADDNPEQPDAADTTEAAALQSAQRSLAVRQRRLASLRTRYGSRHPEVVDARSRVASLEQTVQIRQQEIVAAKTRQHTLDKRRLSTLEADRARVLAGLDERVADRLEYASLIKQRNGVRDVLRATQAQFQTARINQGILASEARISDRASAPPLPYRPQRLIFTALALVTSLILSLVSVGVVARLDRRRAPPRRSANYGVAGAWPVATHQPGSRNAGASTAPSPAARTGLWQPRSSQRRYSVRYGSRHADLRGGTLAGAAGDILDSSRGQVVVLPGPGGRLPSCRRARAADRLRCPTPGHCPDRQSVAGAQPASARSSNNRSSRGSASVATFWDLASTTSALARRRRLPAVCSPAIGSRT